MRGATRRLLPVRPVQLRRWMGFARNDSFAAQENGFQTVNPVRPATKSTRSSRPNQRQAPRETDAVFHSSRMGLDVLLPVLNKLHDACSKVDLVHQIDLPQIVMVGAQSSGKSSVLEHIVGFDFLPRGSGIVTRRPLVLQMKHLTEEVCAARRMKGEPTMYATFSYSEEVYTDMSEVRDEIQRETDRVCSENDIDPRPIYLTIASNHVVDSTMIDLPGLTKVSVKGQSTDIERRIKRMVKEWITPENTIIVAVTPANADIASSDALAIAKLVDPKRKRTIGVLTKVDLMDEGTDCLDILEGRAIDLAMGFTAVKNRSQQSINDGKLITTALEDEEQFFKNHPVYGKLASRLGTPNLSLKLSRTLHASICEKLPAVREHTMKLLDETNESLAQLGPVVASTGELLSLLNTYAKRVQAELDGQVEYGHPEEERKGYGARIAKIYDQDLQITNPLEGMDADGIRAHLEKTRGTRSTLDPLNTAGLDALLVWVVGILHTPAKSSIQSVNRLLQSLLRDEAAMLKNYPVLKQELQDFVQDFLVQKRMVVEDYIKMTIEINKARINTKHPNFFGGGDVQNMLSELLKSSTSATARNSLADDDAVELVRKMATVYFDIVKRDIKDLLPKAIEHSMVNGLRKELYSKLVEKFYSEDRFDTLMVPDSAAAHRRKQEQEFADSLQEVLDELEKLRDYRF